MGLKKGDSSMKLAQIVSTLGVIVLAFATGCGSGSNSNGADGNPASSKSSGCEPSASPFGGGSGKENDPFLLCSVSHLKTMASSLAEDSYVLTTDIDLSQEHETLGYFMTGSFDGQNHTLRNFHVNIERGQGGGWLFGGMNSPLSKVPVIRNLNLDNFTIEGDRLESAAALLGANHGGKVINVHVTNTRIRGKKEIAGIVAYNKGSIEDSSFSGTVQGEAQIGGIVARSEDYYVRN